MITKLISVSGLFIVIFVFLVIFHYRNRRRFMEILFFFNVIAILWLTLINRSPGNEYMINIELFRTLKESISKGAIGVSLIRSIENFLLFVPFGYQLGFFLLNKRNVFFKVFSISLLFCLIIELTQLFFMLGCFEIDDVIYNAFGALIGYLLNYIVQCIFQTKKDNRSSESV